MAEPNTDIQFHYIRNIVGRGEVILQHSKMVADLLPKATARIVFKTHIRSLELCRI